MEVIHSRCAGIDISKRDAKVCVRIAGSGPGRTVETVTTWSSMTAQILALRDHLVAEGVTCVVMEATGDYWKPFYYLLEDAGFELMLVNARHARNVPGRKTDVADATWLAQLGAHGLIRASFVPPEPIRRLRDLTRTRLALTRERTREAQRLEKLLEDSGIKLSAVASEVLGVSGREMLEALIAGKRDPQELAQLAHLLAAAEIGVLGAERAGDERIALERREHQHFGHRPDTVHRTPGVLVLRERLGEADELAAQRFEIVDERGLDGGRAVLADHILRACRRRGETHERGERERGDDLSH